MEAPDTDSRETVQLSENYELSFKQMWEEAQLKFEKVTKKKLVQTNNRGLEDILRELETKLGARDAKDNDRKQKFRRLAVNVLNLIQLLGGIAAQGASLVFGPANMCFNAVQYLIAVPSKISKFYDDLTLLFQEISTFMERFKIYQRIDEYTSLNVELKRGTHQLMIIFVDICAISIDTLYGSPLEKLKIGAKLILFNDTTVQTKLDEFKRLTAHQSYISDAVTLEHVLKSESETKSVVETLRRLSESSRKRLEEESQKVQQELKDTHDAVQDVKAGTEILVKDVADRSSIIKHQECIDGIRRKLSVDLSTIQLIERETDQMRSYYLRGTGSWLHNIDGFNRWIDLGSEADPLLWIEGSSGTGKSHLAFAIMENLQKRYNVADSNSLRVSWASYCFIGNEKSPRNNAVLDALNSIVVQIAKQSPSYAKNLDLYLDSRDPSLLRDPNVVGLFEELIHPANIKDIPDTAYVLSFDGLDQLYPDDARKLVASILGIRLSKTRIMITGTAECYHSCSKQIWNSSVSVTSISVAEYNEPDIRYFIDSEPNACKTLQSDAKEISEIKESVKAKLPSVAEGNFVNVMHIIENVSEAVSSEWPVEAIERLISPDTLRNRPAAMKLLIEELHESLNSQELEQLEEILCWTIYAFTYVSVNDMRAALIVRTKRAPLQSLEDKVAQKYSKLLSIDSAGVFVIKNTYLGEFFRSSNRERVALDMDENDDPGISMTIKVDHVRLSQAKRFFWDLSEKLMLEKFVFPNAMTSQALKNKTPAISADRIKGHLLLTRRCFDLLMDECEEGVGSLGSYALHYLPTHLCILRSDAEAGLLEASEKVEIIECLIDLLQSPECFEKHLTTSFFGQGGWLDVSDQLQAWLHDPEADGMKNRKAKRWLKQVNLGSIVALQEIAIMVARQWLCSRRFSASLPFEWMDKYLDKVVYNQAQGGDYELESPRVDNDNIPIKEAKPTDRLILRACEWAENEAQILKDSKWYERLGETYSEFGHIQLSEDAFLTAEKLRKNSWRISQGLAEVYSRSEDKSLAIQDLELALNSFKRKEPTDVLSDDERLQVAQGSRTVAELQLGQNNSIDTIHKLHEAIQADEHSYQTYYKLLKVLVATQHRSKALDLITSMSTQSTEDDCPTKLESMLLECLDLEREECFEIVIATVSNHKTFWVVLGLLQRMIASARWVGANSKNDSDVIFLKFLTGVALAYYSHEEEYHDYALSAWRECCRLGFRTEQSQMGTGWLIALRAARHVFNLLISNARKTPGAAEDFRSHESELVDLMEGSQNEYYASFKLHLWVGSFYKLSGQQDEAQKLLLTFMARALRLVTNEDSVNDFSGYYMMASILTHMGDDLNALSAWSLYGPPERYKKIDSTEMDKSENKSSQGLGEIEPSTKSISSVRLPFHCDGRCSNYRSWTYADSIWICRVCDDVYFDEKCLERLKKGILDRDVCSPDHEWLHIPSWVEEYQATGKGCVRVGGELLDGQRIGGDIIAVGEWLGMIREKWGIEKLIPY